MPEDCHEQPIAQLAHVFDDRHVGVLIGHWWNQLWGTLTRRDIRLEYDERVWVVEIRQGGTTTGRWLYTDEEKALAAIRDLKKTGAEQWRDLTRAFQASEEAAERRRNEP
jgi:hypothetical protein